MAHPIKVCSICGEEFELRPDKPGFANRCPACTGQELADPAHKDSEDARQKGASELNAARREAMRNLLYRKDS
jgi:hypothetical protein